MPRKSPSSSQSVEDVKNYESATSDPDVKEGRDRFDYALDQWKKNFDEGDTDTRFLAGDSWDPDERNTRRDEGRPALHFDELNQWTNQLINQIRQNKRAVKVDARGSGKHDKEAQLRAGMIRDIEYESNAQAAYITAAESAAQRGIGHWALRTQFVSDSDFNQCLRVRRIPNQRSVVIDPDFKEADASDIRYAWIIDSLPKREYKELYPKAKIVDFSVEYLRLAPKWISDEEVQVAEYYVRNFKASRLLHAVMPGDNIATIVREEDLPKGVTFKDLRANNMIRNSREIQSPFVKKKITNGLEILEETDWVGKWIPIITVFGKELWVNYGSGAERVLFSLIRLARDPQKLLNYYRTGEAEEAGMTPKTPFIGIKGQFKGMEQAWQAASKQPTAYLEYYATTDKTGSTVLPAPQRQPFQPNFAAYEIAAESARRGVMAAVGATPLPTSAQRLNEKSGIALQQIQATTQLGTYHFIDNFDRALQFSGRQIDEAMFKVYDIPQDVGIRDAEDNHKMQRINDPDDADAIALTDSDNSITISTGPSTDSQRDAAQEFAELLAKIPGVFPEIADLIVKLKNLGPIGDSIAERLTPAAYRSQDGQPPLPPQAIQAMQQLTKQLQALHELVKMQEQAIDDLKRERDAKIVENEGKERVAAIQAASAQSVAQIKAGQDRFETLLTEQLTSIRATMKLAHDSTQADLDRAHEQDLAAKAAEQAAQQPAAGAVPGSANGTPAQTAG